jgi:hypothetical protein
MYIGLPNELRAKTKHEAQSTEYRQSAQGAQGTGDRVDLRAKGCSAAVRTFPCSDFCLCRF